MFAKNIIFHPATQIQRQKKMGGIGKFLFFKETWGTGHKHGEGAEKKGEGVRTTAKVLR